MGYFLFCMDSEGHVYACADSNIEVEGSMVEADR